jgi:cobalamin biosynthesis protein CobT
MAKKLGKINKDWISRDDDFVHRGGYRSGWDRADKSNSSYVLGGADRRGMSKELDLREINTLCMNRCRILADGKRVAFSINPVEPTAATDGRRVRVGTKVLNEPKPFFEQADIMLGLTTHEMAHILHSDFEVLKRAKDGFHKAIMNVIEDERIEHLLSEEFPGYANNLATTKKYFLDEVYRIDKELSEEKRKLMSDEERIALEIFDLFFKFVRYPKDMDENLLAEHENAIDEIKEILTPYPMTSEEMETASEQIHTVLTSAIKKKISSERRKKKKEEKMKSECKSGSGSGDSSSEDGSESKEKEDKGGKAPGKSDKSEEEEEEESPKAKEEEEEEEEEKSSGDEEEEDDDKESGEEEESSGDSDESEEEEEEGSEDESSAEEEEEAPKKKKEKSAAKVTEDMKEMIGKLMEEFNSENDPTAPHSEANPAVVKIKFNEEIIADKETKSIFRNGEGNSVRYNKFVDKVRGDARRLASSLLTRVFNEAKTLRGMRSGELDEAKIVDAAHGIKTVHKQITQKEIRKLNIVVLIDESGSMGHQGGPKVDSATQAAILLEKAFEIFPAGQLFMYGFTSDIEAEWNNTIYRYREPGLKVKHGVGGVRGRSNNRDGHVIRAVARRVRTFSNDPMLFFVISDGQPAASMYGGYDDTRAAVTEITKMRFFPIQIGIGKDLSEEEQKMMFDEFVHYDDARQMVDDLRKLILRKAHKIFGL